MVRIHLARRAAWISGAASVALLAGLATSSQAFAQVQPDPAAQESTGVGEIMVTAERRTENLQKVPISATVLGATQLEEQGVNRAADLQTIAPALEINTYNRSTFINIRGVGIAVSAPTSTPGVAYYIDGAFIPHETNIGNTFYDLDTVEVLRGPQGTLTGQNSTGGAIYTRTADPKFDHVFGYVDQTIGDYNSFRTVAAANLPINSVLGLRLAGAHEQRDSFYTNVGGLNQPGNVDFTSFRGNLEFKPNDRLQVNLRYQNDSNKNHGNAYKNRYSLLPTLPNGSANPIYNPNPRQINEDALGYFNQTGYRSDLEAKYTIVPSLLLRYMFSYQYGHVIDLVDGDRSTQSTSFVLTGVPANAKGRLGYTSTTNNIKMNEFDFISQGDGPLQYVAGVFTLDERVPVRLVNDGSGTVNLNTNTPSQLGGTGPNPTIATSLNTSRSIFGQVTYRFNPELQLIAGMRYSVDKQDYTRIGIPGFPLSGAALDTSFRSTKPTGRVALNYNASDNTLVYFSLSRGYKAGGVNLTQGNPAISLPANFLPETNTQEEVGIKTDFFDHHLRVNADIFMSQYDNLQLSTLTATVPPNPYTTNVPKSTTGGGEIEVTAKFGYFELNSGVSILNAKTDSTLALSDGSVNPALLRTVGAGTRLPFSPEYSANVGAQYDFYFGGQRLTPRIQVSSVAKQWATIFQTQGTTGLNPGGVNTATLVPAHTLTDLRLTYAPQPHIEVEAFATNIFNKLYVAAQVQDSSSANGGIIYGAPRQFGVRLIYKYK